MRKEFEQRRSPVNLKVLAATFIIGLVPALTGCINTAGGLEGKTVELMGGNYNGVLPSGEICEAGEGDIVDVTPGKTVFGGSGPSFSRAEFEVLFGTDSGCEFSLPDGALVKSTKADLELATIIEGMINDELNQDCERHGGESCESVNK